MSWLRKRLTFANVVAFMALFIVLGGAAFAAGKITGTQIVNHSITGKDIKAGSIPLTALRKIPVSKQGPAGEPGEALAYAHVKADGTLDKANSKNVSASKLTAANGYYCVTPTVPVKNMVATPTDTISARTIIAQTGDPFTSCPDDAVVVMSWEVTKEGPKTSSTAFYIAFN